MIKIVAKKISPTQSGSHRQNEMAAVKYCLDTLLSGGHLLHTSSGAPFLEGMSDKRISITHSRFWVAVAVAPSEDGLFGIDIESYDRKDQLMRVIGRVAHSHEKPYLNGVDAALKLWTAKEAGYKTVSRDHLEYAKDLMLYFPECKKIRYLPDERDFNVNYMSIDENDLLCIVSENNNYEFKTL